jgi:hypothetical protein
MGSVVRFTRLTRTRMTSFFPDLNVWLALSDAGNFHHSKAWNWLNSLPHDTRLLFSRYTQLGLLRLLTNQSVMENRRLRSERPGTFTIIGSKTPGWSSIRSQTASSPCFGKPQPPSPARLRISGSAIVTCWPMPNIALQPWPHSTKGSTISHENNTVPPSNRAEDRTTRRARIVPSL